MTARVGKPAPEFQTKAYVQGEIKDVSILAYRGKWVMLYFYPGDFTFV
jgi:peroxiredoxin (alkyl hydroperoxide reductase subunit C)